MQKLSNQLRTEGKKISLVPTMGSLHQGHLSLIDLAKKNSDIVIVSIFVNPAQFAPNEDFNNYPRDFETDKRNLIEKNVDFLFFPDQKEIYPDEFQTFIEVNKITKSLEGEFRPTHFKGVTTIVSILFNTVKPHIAVFGQKDAQQSAAIKQMINDLKIDIELLLAPIIREPDGLAMSSRNVYLNPAEREKAILLYKSLQKGKEIFDSGEREVKKIIRSMNIFFAAEKSIHLNYIKIVEADTFKEVEQIEERRNYYLLIAAKIGNVRLIDNILIP